MKTVSIELYALKSTRKNAAYQVKHFHIFPDPNIHKLKKRFSNNDFVELQNFVTTHKDKYPVFQIVVHDGTNTLSNGDRIMSTMHYFVDGGLSPEQAENVGISFMSLYNNALENDNYTNGNFYNQHN